MTTVSKHIFNNTYWLKSIAILALIFGLATLVSGGSILFGGGEAANLAGAYVPFVVWFNFFAGFFYVLAAIGIWFRQSWAFGLSALIVIATAITALAFGVHVVQGGAFEMRTVGALMLRAGVWTAIAWFLYRGNRRS